MNTVTFDTHKFIKQLQAKGVPEEQAEAMVDVIANMQNAASANVTTKPETVQFKSELANDIKLLEARIDNKFEQVKADISLLKYGISYLIATITGLVVKAIFF